MKEGWVYSMCKGTNLQKFRGWHYRRSSLEDWDLDGHIQLQGLLYIAYGASSYIVWLAELADK